MKKYGQIQIYSPNTKAKKHLFSSHFLLRMELIQLYILLLSSASIL